MKALMWWSAVVLVAVAASLSGTWDWLRDGRVLSAREGWFIAIVVAAYAAWVSHSSLRGRLEDTVRDRDIAIRDLRIQDASIMAAMIRFKGPQEGETQEDVEEQAHRFFVAQLEEIDPKRADMERAQHADWKKAMADLKIWKTDERDTNET